MNDVMKVLEPLAAKLGVTIEYLWQVLLQQALIAGLTDVVLWGVTTVAICYTIRYWRWAVANRCEWREAIFMGPIAVSVVVSILTIIQLCGLSETMAALLNPEYWALHKVLSLVAK